ncbi:hypothetical protein WA158_007585 [Blastocystis sp. Blastoise]
MKALTLVVLFIYLFVTSKISYIFFDYTFLVDACESSEIPIKIKVHHGQNCNNEQYYVVEGASGYSTKIILEMQTAQSSNCRTVVTHTLCLKYDTYYNLVLVKPEDNGWDGGSYATVTFEDMELAASLFYINMFQSNQQKFVPFNTFMCSRPESDWKYTSVAQTTDDWTKPEYVDNDWSVGHHNSFDKYNMTTRYYRKNATLTNSDTYGLLMRLYTTGGYIIYINGIQIQSYNLPSGTITPTTTPTFSYTNNYFTGLTFSQYNIKGTILTICIEVHIPSSFMNQRDQFYFMIHDVSSADGLEVGGGGTVECSGGELGDYTCGRIFDRETAKYLYNPGKTMIITFPNNSPMYFNEYRIISGDDLPSRDPKNWILYGSNDKQTWDTLDTIKDNSFPHRVKYYSFPLPSNKKSYRYVKLYSPNSNGDQYVQFCEILFFLNNHKYLDTITYNYNPIVFFKNYENSIKPISNGYTTYQITPSLPSSLSIDSQIGRIYGNPSSTYNLQNYTISAKEFDKTSKSIIMGIQVTECKSPLYKKLKFIYKNKENGSHERIYIYNKNNILLYSFNGYDSATSQDKQLCFEAGSVFVTLSSTKHDYWQSGSVLEIQYIEESTTYFSEYLYLLGESSHTYKINTNHIVNMRDTWMRMNTLPGSSDWLNPSYNTSDWSSYTYSGSISSKYVSLRKEISSVDLTDATGWQFITNLKCGAVIYINGVEMARYNLPQTGSISTSTTGTCSSYSLNYLSGPMTLFKYTKKLVISIIYIRSSTSSDTFSFYGIFRFITDTSVPQPIKGTASNDYTIAHPIENLIDKQYGASWITDVFTPSKTVNVKISLDSTVRMYSNKYCFISTYDCDYYDPREWNLYGSNDDSNYNKLSYVSNILWSDRNQRRCFYITENDQNHNKAYRYFKLSLFTSGENSISDYRYAIGEFEFYMDDTNMPIPPLSVTPSIISLAANLNAPTLTYSSPYYTGFQISPTLPTGLYIDYANGQIHGHSALITPKTIYTITCSDIRGKITSSVKITLDIHHCPNPNTAFSLFFDYQPTGNVVWMLKNSQEDIVDYRTSLTKGSKVTFYFCVPGDLYTMTITNSDGVNWNGKQYKVYNEYGNCLVSNTFTGGASNNHILDLTGVIHQYYTQWSHLAYGNSPPSNWNTNEYSPKDWPVDIADTISSYDDSITVYHRTVLDLDVLSSKITGIQITVGFTSGIIIYMNGFEIFRRNMPTGTITAITPSTVGYGSHSSYDIDVNIRESSYVYLTNNVIAVEIHKPVGQVSTIYSKFYFKAKAVLSTVNLMESKRVWSDNFGEGTNQGLSNAFDNNDDTKYYRSDHCAGTFIIWRFSDDNRKLINSYSITNANDCHHREPLTWKLEGSNNDHQTWTLLDYRTNIQWTNYKETKSFDFYTDTAFNIYRFTVIECRPLISSEIQMCGQTQFQIAEIRVFSKTHTKPLCPSEGDWPSVNIANGKSIQSCPNGKEGYQYKTCSSSGTLSTTSQDNCSSGSLKFFLYRQTSFVLYTGKSVYIPSMLLGGGVTFSSSNLPTGLKLSSLDGSITGNTTTIVSSKTATITASKSGTTYTAQLTFTVKKYLCLKEGDWPETDIGQTVTKDCVDINNYEGKRTRRCIGDYITDWSPVSDSCILKNNKISYNSSRIDGYVSYSITTLVPILWEVHLASQIIVTPELPTGLTINKNTGGISGSVSKKIDEDFNIKVVNIRGTSEDTIHISILLPQCETDNEWEKIDALSTQYIYCPDKKGVQKRSCLRKSKTEAVWDTIDTSLCYKEEDYNSLKNSTSFIYVHTALTGIKKEHMEIPLTYENYRSLFAELLNNKVNTKDIHIIEIFDGLYGLHVILRILVNDDMKETIKEIIYERMNNIEFSLYNTLKTSEYPYLSDITSLKFTPQEISDTIVVEYAETELSTDDITFFVIFIIGFALVATIVAICIRRFMNNKEPKKTEHRVKTTNNDKNKKIIDPKTVVGPTLTNKPTLKI